MTAKTRRVLLYILISLVILTLFTASLTLGRYSGEYESDSDYSGDIEYVVADQVEVHSVEDFFAAINNGYSNIKIADDVDNPLIIMGGVSDVNSDLVIDLNGHEIQRNNREPLLNVTQGVRLTIIDSSENQTGSFYNPVGSVLQISGGTLTIAAGSFESGPRSSDARNSGDLNEYANSELTDDKQNRSQLIWRTPAGAYTDVNYYVDVLYTNTEASISDVHMPVIIPDVDSDGNGRGVTVNGNMYFESMYGYYTQGTWWAPVNDTRYVTDDTYLYFTIEDETVENTTIAADGSADYYYEYYLKPEITDGQVTYLYAGQPESLDEPTPEGYRRVTVYVYQNVKGSANLSGDTPDYAAIKMQEGNLYVRGGTYYSYFGEDNTFCVDATGGYMAVESGDFYAYESSVCVQCDYAVADDNNYLRVTDGTFNSEVGDTVRVNNGRMTIQTVTFNKDATGVSGSDYRDNGSAINIAGGALEILTSAQFNLSGSYMDGISASGAASSVTANNATINFNVQQNQDGFSATNANNYNRGIYANGGEVVCNGDTSVRMGAENTNRTAQFCYGIYSVNGAITCGTQGSNAQTAVYIYGRTVYTVENYGIATEGGTVTCYGQTGITVYGQQSVGIYSSAAEISENTYSGGEISISGTDFTCEIRMYTGANTLAQNLSGTAISTTGGNIVFNVDSATIISDGLGITALNKIYSGTTAGDIIPGSGNVTFETTATSAEIELTTSRGTAMYILGGEVEIDEAITFDVESNTNDNLPWQANGTAYSTDGIRIESGSLLSYGTLNVEHRGTENDVSLASNINNRSSGVLGSQLHTQFEIASYAVSVTAGEGSSSDVIITKGEIINNVGGGIYVGGGDVQLGVEGSTDDSLLTVTLNGDGYESSGYGGNDGSYIWYRLLDNRGVIRWAAGNWGYRVTTTGGRAVEANGGAITVYNGTYTTAQGDALLVRNGTANIWDGTFIGNDAYDGDDNPNVYTAICGPAASYAFKMYGGTANIYGGNFGSTSATGSGAFIMGTGVDEDSLANANIYGGSFIVSQGNSGGQGAISVLEYANVLFAPRGGENGAGGDIIATGLAGGLIIEGYWGHLDITHDAKIEVRGGSFSSTADNQDNSDGIWYYNTNAELIISGGTFTGNRRSGLFIYGMDTDSVITISGGTFTTNRDNGNYGAITGVNRRYSEFLADGYNAYSSNTNISTRYLSDLYRTITVR